MMTELRKVEDQLEVKLETFPGNQMAVVAGYNNGADAAGSDTLAPCTTSRSSPVNNIEGLNRRLMSELVAKTERWHADMARDMDDLRSKLQRVDSHLTLPIAPDQQR